MVGVVGIIIKINSFFFQKPPGYETVSARLTKIKSANFNVKAIREFYYPPALRYAINKFMQNLVFLVRTSPILALFSLKLLFMPHLKKKINFPSCPQCYNCKYIYNALEMQT